MKLNQPLVVYIDMYEHNLRFFLRSICKESRINMLNLEILNNFKGKINFGNTNKLKCFHCFFLDF